MGNHLHRSIREIACHAREAQSFSLLAGAVPKIDTLHLAGDTKAARYSFHGQFGTGVEGTD